MSQPAKPKNQKTFQAPRGTYDILPDEQIYWEKIYKTIKEVFLFYGFGRIDTPVIEDADLYVRATGETTDIVEKQMYLFKSKGGDSLALRPEFTPGVIRAYLEDGLSALVHPVKLYSWGPLFRYENPQTGRYRQFHQVNLEVIGSKAVANDAEVIQLFFVVFRELGLKAINLHINSIGCSECQPHYRKLLLGYYKNRADRLCADCRRRFRQNPLRLLDCKDEHCIQLMAGVPQMIDHLCEECHTHFKSVLEFLDELEIPYILNQSLVRGLDYYTKTVFEFWPDGEQARQGALGGGGRYDYLIKFLGGKDTPAVGGGIGVERLIAQLKFQAIKFHPLINPRVFLVQLGELARRRGFKIFEELRKANIAAAAAFSKDSIKTQLKLADRAEIKMALILGQQEVLDGTIIVRDMTTGAQETIKQDKLILVLKKRLAKKIINQ
ncbi:MAG: histidine--tRNA ligase [Candidatus Portnoybacteria bacterium CG_4_8_14_3_um_filter_44_10]|uniref:Histidine--tRNA ligase n=5 Tax=Candidatus Portnoyibacteriota TaxID=1817913 RepID=A0A2H0KR33_9BACT|nr:MAG: histidine--tRNA ligase [Candidatus Portnoybacteria bacterium CG11_big_fil_rev_8_21_14_0_20_44_10]PIS16430.1 MAG: histidine--tRNA ligase [Candidatus Portnoybacteria bacterium CG09_land_8_20_14_0_10_44_13]PIW75125.1 MAG: histidine--tRNA ligase [Candidatus Portnoybacteria bacterium CG_4_8_14_3_um_filter_44_10]PIZ69179.1 MAG: histidine--tRNA ligase [Candidatus Portnoybacteria bacterium CG_4_10_14_0_2_um_filter_44_20]PJA63812.1 MAG: histidine--tRNA ligase [Candidatus Portnoybacteria bacteriu